ncbi:glycine-rich domain-containing protein [Merismopedia glauca]|uniref:Glycine-rich domain-containing protein-like n=1 Tax=Merismopedia glauca CCAP 1448/3 TaxID=1296344 RepID=A0A2T1C0X8_9CYAN|nr:hypothetical protein [Merismopedia glauca]PSB01854.1 hypothetical protein C7B64_16110 [Merismopedia glauca CCAP 1448/3]
MLTSIKPDLKDFLEKLNRVNFGDIAYRLIQREGWSLEQATTSIEEYRRFLVLCYLYSDRRLVPTQNVDMVWHEAIIHTEKYQKTCLELFGYIVHHYPDVGTSDGENHQAIDTAFAETCQLMDKHFT